MEIAPARELKVGRIVETTLDVVERCAVPAAIYVIAMTLVNGAIAYFGLGYSSGLQEVAKGALSFIFAIVATYLLVDAMLRRFDYIGKDTDDVIVAFALFSIVYSIAVGVGFLLIVFPGLYMMARWSVAQPTLIANGMGAFDAMKESWARTKGSEFPILIVILILIVVPAAIAFFIGTQFADDNAAGIAIAQLVSAISSMLGIAMGVALYRLIIVDTKMAEVRTFD